MKVEQDGAVEIYAKPSDDAAGRVIGSILRHDAKTNSYKMALLRAINDVVLAYPGVAPGEMSVAVPLRTLGEYWVAYYWPFVEPGRPVWQGPRTRRRGGLAQDILFRASLTEFRKRWEAYWGVRSRPSDGFVVMNEMRVPRRRQSFPNDIVEAYGAAVARAAYATQQPIRYAGPGNWSVFTRPTSYASVRDEATAVPGTRPRDQVLLIGADLWQQFRQLSIWIEALCIHEWSLFTETVDPTGGWNVDRGDVYRLLTDRPDNRRPLSWERNQVDILLMEGTVFTCPWTGCQIVQGAAYDLDHIVPISVYPTNELWNLVPSDPWFNQHRKRAKLASDRSLRMAHPVLADTYAKYGRQALLSRALREDVGIRFSGLDWRQPDYPQRVADCAVRFVTQLAAARNIERFESVGA